MDNQQLRWLAFSGKGEDFPAWSERFLAFCRTKNLYKTVLGKDIPPPEIGEPLADGAEGPAIAEHTRQVTAREKEITDMDTRKDTVWCYLAMSLDTTSLTYVRHDCRNEDGTSDGTKAWKMLQKRFCNIEKTTVRDADGSTLAAEDERPRDDAGVSHQGTRAGDKGAAVGRAALGLAAEHNGAKRTSRSVQPVRDPGVI